MIGDGSISYPGNYKLYVQDGILTERVKVALSSTADWADTVFSPSYPLLSLDSVECYISNHQHLPNMPSAAELVAGGGIDLKDIITLQQAKIEELFLYILELNRKFELQNVQFQQLSTK